jgi:4-alpha-glucanotransferase
MALNVGGFRPHHGVAEDAVQKPVDVCFGNSIHDAAMLEIARHAFAVNPNPDLGKIAQFAGISAPNESSDFDRDFYGAIMEALFRCESWIALVMITDLLGRKDRFNVPGTAASSNWSKRMAKTIGELKKSRRVGQRMRLIRELLERTGRI